MSSAVMNVSGFHARRRFVHTGFGRIAYLDDGRGAPAVFVHGVPLNGFHWRHVIAGVRDMRRCIALDLMGLGYSEIDPAQDVSFTAQAHMIAQVLDALGLERIDLVGNDSGGAIAQIFAAHYPHRLATLTLTNCDVHDGWPPAQILPVIESARQGRLAELFERLLADPDTARTRFARGESVPLFRAYADPTVLTNEVIRVYLEPLLASAVRRSNFHRYWLGFDNAQTVAIEPRLRTLPAPTLIVWALQDFFFDVKWAHWLQRTLPNVERLVQVSDGRLFFPEDRPQSLIEPLRAFWGAHAAGAG